MQGFCLAAVIFGRKIGLPECGIFSADEKHGILNIRHPHELGHEVCGSGDCFLEYIVEKRRE